MSLSVAMSQLLHNVTFMKARVLVVLIIVMTFSHAVNNTWQNWIQLDENYLLQWNVSGGTDGDVTFEMQVRAHGYVGFGLSRDGTIFGSDVFISWIDDGHMFFYVSKIFNFKIKDKLQILKIFGKKILGLDKFSHFLPSFQPKSTFPHTTLKIYPPEFSHLHQY